MPRLGSIKYPNVTFLNLQTQKHVSVNIASNQAELKSSKRVNGNGNMYRIAAVKDGQKYSRIIGESDYHTLKRMMGTSSRSRRSSSRNSRSGKRMRSLRKKSTRKKSTRKKSTRKKSRSGKKMRPLRRSSCNKKLRTACKASNECAYIPAKRTGRKSRRHKSYCRSMS